MTIIAVFRPKNVSVEILDVFDGPQGIKLACVRALDGKPFVGGDKWPVATSFATVPTSDLTDVAESVERYPKPLPANLLSLALAAARLQWYSGESVWLVGGPHKGAYLKNLSGWVYLFVIGYSKGLPVFYFDPGEYRWKECRQVKQNYQDWSAEARRALEGGKMRGDSRNKGQVRNHDYFRGIY
jgi:hypothetical protein